MCNELRGDGTGRDAPRLDPRTLQGLPAPAQRFLRRVLPDGVALQPAVELRMRGRIRLGPRWFDFTAEQILRAGVGFVWQPTVGARLLRFEGADQLGPHGAAMDFRLHGRIPVVRADGPDVERSALGRLAAETVAWLPQALAPQRGAHWRAIDDERCTVDVAVPGGTVQVEVLVDEAGRLRDIVLERFRDSASPPRYAPFGATVHRELESSDGVLVAGAGSVGWDHGTADEEQGCFFDYTLESVDPLT